MNPAGLTLTSEELAASFPFHFAVDRQWKVVQHGRNLPRICPRIAVGQPAHTALRLIRPEVAFQWSDVSAHTRSLFLLECLDTGVSLRGQMLPLASGQEMLFLGSPWFTAASDVLDAGLGLEDFAIHDPGMDMLLVMHAQVAAVEELKELAQKLTRQRSELRIANLQLQDQNAALESARQALARSEAEARLLGLVAARTNNGVVITDDHGRIVWVNQGFTRITGYELDEVKGQTPGRILQGTGTDPATVTYMRECLRDHRGFETEVLNYAKDGTPYWLSIEVQPVRNAEGTLTHYLAIETDITGRRQAQEALRAEKEMLTSTLASIIDGVIAVDAQQRVRLLNPTAETLTGWTHETAQGQHLAAVLPLATEEGASAPNLIEQAFEQRHEVGDVHGTEPRWILKSLDGTVRIVVASARPMFDGDHAIVGGLVVFRDVSAEIEVDQMKRDFVYAVSHELRTPLTSIRGFLATLQSDPEIPAATRKDFLNIVSDQALRLSHLVEDILEISRIEAGQTQFEIERVDLRDLALRSLHEILPLAVRKHLRLDAQVPAAVPAVLGDPDRVRSIFSNLLGNAVKFTPEGGTVTLELITKNPFVVISVRDTGIGIPPDQHDRIFQKFFRVRRPGSQIAGTGLGLSIVQSVVERMGGSIEVESVPDQGTCFRVFLPAAEAAAGPDA
ncbi:MAG: PAS domain S-box protein [Verrucomicrobiales bacterium]|nr:PAS domain S-box protein [Verrucomicrobiales bacterium]